MSERIVVENMSFAAPPVVQVMYRRSLAVAAVGLILSIVGFVVNYEQALHSYLVGFLWTLGFTLGPMAVLMLWHMSGGAWGVPIRRILEAASRNVLFNAILFIPVAIGVRHIFPWTDPSFANQSAHAKLLTSQYLDVKFFILRAVLYFVGWWALSYQLNKWSELQDSPPDRFLGRKLGALSAGGMIAYIWLMTFGAVDWVMSLAPGWNSTIFPLIVVVGQGLTGFCLCVIMGRALVKYEPMSVLMNTKLFHDLGKLILAFVMLWAYFSYSQWLIMWSGNLPEEIHWFLDRIHGGWGGWALFLALFHFAVPFALLLSRPLKQNVRTLFPVAVWLVFMRWFDLVWDVEPGFAANKAHFRVSGLWMDIVIPLTLAAIWFALFLRNLGSRPLVALHDPRFRAVLGEGHE